MTLVETKKFLALMGVFYPAWKPAADMELVAEAWTHDLANVSLDDLNAAFAIYRAQGNQFPPAQPGVLTSLLADATDDSLPESEAWALVAAAKRNGIYHAQEEFDALPPDVQRAVGSPDQLREWAMMETKHASVTESNFKRAYRSVLERKSRTRLPSDVSQRLAEIRGRALIGGKE